MHDLTCLPALLKIPRISACRIMLRTLINDCHFFFAVERIPPKPTYSSK